MRPQLSARTYRRAPCSRADRQTVLPCCAPASWRFGEGVRGPRADLPRLQRGIHRSPAASSPSSPARVCRTIRSGVPSAAPSRNEHERRAGPANTTRRSAASAAARRRCRSRRATIARSTAAPASTRSGHSSSPERSRRRLTGDPRVLGGRPRLDSPSTPPPRLTAGPSRRQSTRPAPQWRTARWA